MPIGLHASFQRLNLGVQILPLGLYDSFQTLGPMGCLLLRGHSSRFVDTVSLCLLLVLEERGTVASPAASLSTKRSRAEATTSNDDEVLRDAGGEQHYAF